MEKLISSHSLFETLKRNGFELPKECCDVRLVMPVDGCYQLHYEVNLTNYDLVKIGCALQDIGMEK